MPKHRTRALTLLVGLLALAPTRLSAWGSNDNPSATDTHRALAAQALLILQRDADPSDTAFIEDLATLMERKADLLAGAIAPDYDPAGYQLFQDHFFDPDTGKNYTYDPLYPLEPVDETAESQTRFHLGVALALWREGRTQEAIQRLGQALHYFSDLCEPHHASNRTGGPGTAHTEFESYVDGLVLELLIGTTGHRTSEAFYQNGWGRFAYLTDVATTHARSYGRKAKAQADFTTLLNSWSQWRKAAGVTTSNTQKVLAQMIYRFLKETRRQPAAPDASALGPFFVEIRTAGTSGAGTDDDVWFGMRFADGRTREFLCDVPGDDFAKGAAWGYQFTLDDASLRPEDLRQVWVRKQTQGSGDDWKPASLAIYMKGTRVFQTTFTAWFQGNHTEQFPMPEVRY